MDILTNYIYLYHLTKFCVLPTMPESISDTMSSSFNATNALSRSAPIQSYNNSGPRQVSFNFDLHRDIMEDLNTDVSNLKDNVVDIGDKDYVDLLLNYLQACALPKYNIYKSGSKAVEPPQVAVRMGNDIFIRGVINGAVSVTYNKPILDNGKYAKVSVSFQVTEVDPYDAPTVAMVGGFRGITAAFKNGIYKDTNESYYYNKQEYVTDTSTMHTTTVNTTNEYTMGIPHVSMAKTVTQKVVPGHNELTIIDFDLKNTLKPKEEVHISASQAKSVSVLDRYKHDNGLNDTSVIKNNTAKEPGSKLGNVIGYSKSYNGNGGGGSRGW